MKKTFSPFIILLSSVLSLTIHAQENADREIFKRYVIEIVPQDKEVQTGELMKLTAEFFLGAPYVAATLEKTPEQLVVNLREMDCMTLVESTVALARTLHSPECTYERFKQNLQDARYRNGQITDYTDRLHYTSDWMYENEKKNIIKDVTKEIGGKPWANKVSFMSTHADKYQALKDNPERVAIMRQKEEEINQRHYNYIPKEEISCVAHNIKDGDIIGFVTKINGLDIAHVGIACWKDGQLSFIHASSDKKKVIINPASLQDYINGIKNNIGIVVLRPQF